MIINDCVTGLCICYTILFIVILKCALSTYKKGSLLKNSMLCYTSSSFIHIVFTCVLIALFSLMLDSISCSVHNGP